MQRGSINYGTDQIVERPANPLPTSTSPYSYPSQHHQQPHAQPQQHHAQPFPGAPVDPYLQPSANASTTYPSYSAGAFIAAPAKTATTRQVGTDWAAAAAITASTVSPYNPARVPSAPQSAGLSSASNSMYPGNQNANFMTVPNAISTDPFQPMMGNPSYLFSSPPARGGRQPQGNGGNTFVPPPPPPPPAYHNGGSVPPAAAGYTPSQGAQPRYGMNPPHGGGFRGRGVGRGARGGFYQRGAGRYNGGDYQFHPAHKKAAQGPANPIVPRTEKASSGDEKGEERYMAGFDVLCYNPSESLFYTIPSEKVMVTEGSKTFIEDYNVFGENSKQRFHLCESYLTSGECAKGGQCENLHSRAEDCPHTRTHRPDPEAMKDIPRVGGDMTFTLYGVNTFNQPRDYPASEVLVTTGSQEYMNTTAHKHWHRCAHFERNLCRKGDTCGFIHVMPTPQSNS